MQTELPRRPYAELAPPPDGLATALRAGRRRRTRRAVAAVTGGATAVVVVTVVLMLGGGGGVAVLRPAPVPPATALPTPSVTSAPPVVGAQPAKPPPSAHPVVSGNVGPGAKRPSATGTAPAGESTAPGDSIVLSRSQTRYTGYPRVCRTGASSDSQSTHPGSEWCRDAAAETADGGKRLSLTLCRDSTSGGSLSFANTREVDFAVVTGGATIWSWRHDHPGTPSQHTLSASADGCWVWSLVWPGVTQAGGPAPHGSYTLVATSTAQELEGDASTQVSFTY